MIHIKRMARVSLISAMTLFIASLLLMAGHMAYANDGNGLIKLDTPSNLALSGTTLSWSRVEHADEYYVSVGVGANGEAVSTGITIHSGDTTSCDIREEILDLFTYGGYTDSSVLTLSITVEARANNTAVYSSSDKASLTVPLSDTGMVIRTTKLEKPSNLAVSGTTLSWGKVDHADKYYVKIGVGKDGSFITTGNTVDSGDVTSFDILETVSDLMTDGGYYDSDELDLRIEIRAKSNNTAEYSDSDAASLEIPLSDTGVNIHIIKLATPTNLSLDNTVLSWDAVENADYYHVKMTVWNGDSGHTASDASGDPVETSFDIDAGLRLTLSSAGLTSFEGTRSVISVQAKTRRPDAFSNSDAAEFTIENYSGAHDWEDHYTEDVSPSCTQTGKKSIHCRTCSLVKNEEVIPKVDHTYGDWFVTKGATCTEDGSKEKVCSVCGDKVTEVIPKTDHQFGDWKTVKAATEIEAGQKTRTCNVCGNTEKQSIAILRPTLPAVKISKPKAAKKAATVKWKKVSKKNQKKIAKIEIQYSTDRLFRTGVKSVFAKKSAASKKISKLAPKKTYYVRIRAYKKSGGAEHVSGWSAVKPVKTK